MLKIALSGCNGRMGRVITDICSKKENMKIVAGFDLYTEKLADYPVFADALCKRIQLGDFERGILVCGTGIGMSIAANKHSGIRAACCSDTYSARLTREHNDANVLCFGARVIGEGLACDLADIFVSTEYMGGKHARRVQMLDELMK